MQGSFDWHRYAVVHWFDKLDPKISATRAGNRTRAFAELAEAVLFAMRLDTQQQQAVRVSCYGKMYDALEVVRLAKRPDFPHTSG
ncbi:hypothetical protein [Methylobacterium oryzisoli]|uniref:hypothetical protein n=1 Tax=Methylobacterium oryzisoli TaxID=3385502 RepID=UPI0038918B23